MYRAGQFCVKLLAPVLRPYSGSLVLKAYSKKKTPQNITQLACNNMLNISKACFDLYTTAWGFSQVSWQTGIKNYLK